MAGDPVARWRKPVGRSLDQQLREIDAVTPACNLWGQPTSVTFPICAFCKLIIWNAPLYEESLEAEWLCDDCARKEIEAQERGE